MGDFINVCTEYKNELASGNVARGAAGQLALPDSQEAPFQKCQGNTEKAGLGLGSARVQNGKDKMFGSPDAIQKSWSLGLRTGERCRSGCKETANLT